MGVIAQYQVSQANPSVVGGAGTTIKYFGSNPVRPAWLAGQPGINTAVDNMQLGATPSSTSANGQLSFDAVAQKLTGGRFRIYASGTASSDTTPTLIATVQINSGSVASPSYATLLGGVATAALTANKAVAWSIAGDLYFDPNAGVLNGWFKYGYSAASGGTPANTQAAEATITVVTGLGLTNAGQYALQPGFVVGVTFGTTSANNTASLYEFKIVED